MTALLVAAVAAGFGGSLHCAVMCGPLAAGACGARRDVGSYAAARTIGYAGVGAVMGAIGQHALCRLPMNMVQSVALGLVALFAAVRAVRAWRQRRAAAPVRVQIRRGRGRAPLLGLLTAILPCGMLMSAWTLAMASGGAGAGATIMAVFSAASLPGLLAPLLAGRALAGRRLPAWVPAVAWSVLTLWLALRPLLMAAHHH